MIGRHTRSSIISNYCCCCWWWYYYHRCARWELFATMKLINYTLGNRTVTWRRREREREWSAVPWKLLCTIQSQHRAAPEDNNEMNESSDIYGVQAHVRVIIEIKSHSLSLYLSLDQSRSTKPRRMLNFIESSWANECIWKVGGRNVPYSLSTTSPQGMMRIIIIHIIVIGRFNLFSR